MTGSFWLHVFNYLDVGESEKAKGVNVALWSYVTNKFNKGEV